MEFSAPIMYKDEQCRNKEGLMWLTKYSDRLLELLPRAHCPEFRDRVKIDHKNAQACPTTLRVVYVDSTTGEESEI